MIKPVFSFESEVDFDSSDTSSVASSLSNQQQRGRRPSAFLPVAPAAATGARFNCKNFCFRCFTE